ncbi:MAG: hypothetical protein OEZ52_14475, partial [Candidatus Aminicenantes bacterium]|nr:hypothetical protein [Candidatus Aminicenantes bacterium]
MKQEWKSLLPYSDKVGRLQEDIERYKRGYLRLWWETSTEFPRLGRIYERRMQKSIAKKLFRFIDHASGRFDECPSEKERKK